MPRGIKGSGKAANKKADSKPVDVVEVKKRKAYPTIDERLVMVDSAIARLEKLNASRKELIEKTEAKLNERRSALEKSEAQLNKAYARKERLTRLKLRPARQLTQKSEDKKRLEELYAVMKAQGKSVDDLIAALQKQ